MVCVLPGVADTRARFFLLQMELIKDDLPTFDLPITAIVGNFFLGMASILTKLPIKVASQGIIFFLYKVNSFICLNTLTC